MFCKSLYHSDLQSRKAKGAEKGFFAPFATAAPLQPNGGSNTI